MDFFFLALDLLSLSQSSTPSLFNFSFFTVETSAVWSAFLFLSGSETSAILVFLFLSGFTVSVSPMMSVNISPILSPFSTNFLQSSLFRLSTARKQFWTMNLPNLLVLSWSSLAVSSSATCCRYFMLECFHRLSSVREPCLVEASPHSSPCRPL